MRAGGVAVCSCEIGDRFQADGVVKESWERAGSFALLGFDL